MTHRERFLAVLRGRRPDRLPFFPRLELWYRLAKSEGRLPAEFSQLSLNDLLRALDFGIYGRQASVFARSFEGIEVVQTRQDNRRCAEYRTPLGTVRMVEQGTQILAQADATFIEVEYPFKSERDYPVLAHIFEHMRFEPTYDDWQRQEEEIGNDGIARVNTSPDPFFALMYRWMGYERVVFELHENPARVEMLLEVLTDSCRHMQQIVLDSPAQLVLTGANYTTAVTSPPLFRRYFLPYLIDFNSRLIERGKLPMAHVDGEIGGRNGGLMPLIREARFRIADALTPAPVTSITVRQALDYWEGELLVWGGIPSLLTSPSVDNVEFEQYFRQVLASVTDHDPFVLGIGDTVAMEADFDRVLQMSRLYHELT